MKSIWYADIDFIASESIADDVAFDVLDALEVFAPAFSFSPDRHTAGLSVAIEAESASNAASLATEIVNSLHGLVGQTDITQIDVMTESVRLAKNAEPSIPDLVGYAEIAEMAGVSRQRAREVASLSGFPTAVVETAAGPLRVREAVASWLEGWTRKPGRPRKSVTV